MTWAKGRNEIDGLIARGEIDRVAPNDALAERYLAEAARHVASARSIVGSDATGSYDLAYDAARKACVALLIFQGLRPTSAGGHVAVADAVQAQFGPPFDSLNRLRRQRNRNEYPDVATPTTTQADAEHAIEVAVRLIEGARGLLGSGQLDRF